MTEEIYLDSIPETNEVYLDQIPEPEELYVDELDKKESPAFITDLGKSIMSGFVRIAEGWTGLEQRIEPYMSKIMTGPTQEELAARQEFLKKTREFWKPTGEGKATWVATILGEAIPQVLTSVSLMGLGGLLPVAVNSYVVESESARQSGASDTESDLIGITNAAIEMWGVNKFFKFAGKGKGSIKSLITNVKNKLWSKAGTDLYNVGGDILKQAMVEGIEESLQEGTTLAIPAAISQTWPKKIDGTPDWSAILSQVGEAGLGGAMAGGIIGGGMTTIAGIPTVGAPSQIEIDNFSEKVNSSKLNDVEKALLLNEVGIKTEALSQIETLRNKFDKITDEIEILRPKEAKEMAYERGKRFGEFRDIVEGTTDPKARVTVAKTALKGRLKIEIAPLESQFDTDSIDFAYDTITRSTKLTEGELLDADEGLQKMLYDGVIPAKSELKALVKAGVLTDKAASNILKSRSFSQKFKDVLQDLSYAPGSILTGLDMSLPGRQGWKVLFKKPALWGRSLGRAYRAFASEDYYKLLELRRQTHPLYQEALESGIEETGLGELKSGEERFLSKMVQKIPGIRTSGRGYIGMANELRFGWYFDAIDKLGHGLTAQQRKDIATIAMDLTGRGKLPKSLNKLQNFLPIFFAPRWIAGNIRSITDLTTVSSPARKMLAGTLASFFGISLSTLFLLDQHPELDVEWNPLSSDFLKVKYGNTRVSILGGYEQLYRTLWQLCAGKRKATETNHLQTADRKEIIWRFLQSKLSPSAGLAVDLVQGKNFRGEKITTERIPENVYDRITPLFIQDVIDTMRWQGIGTAATIAPLAFHGITVQTYPKTTTQELIKYKDQLAQQYFNGMIWDEIGPKAQQMITETHPLITYYSDKVKREREDVTFTAKIANESFQAGRNVFDKLSKSVQNEMNSLVIPPPGLSRYIGSNWYLNDKRYATYQKQVQLLLDSVLTDIVSDPSWNSLPMDIRKTAIQEIIDRVTATVRKNITMQANINDVSSPQNLK